eukprot:1183252-Prorocentrum_minimum.AAC.2
MRTAHQTQGHLSCCAELPTAFTLRLDCATQIKTPTLQPISRSGQSIDQSVSQLAAPVRAYTGPSANQPLRYWVGTSQRGGQ